MEGEEIMKNIRKRAVILLTILMTVLFAYAAQAKTVTLAKKTITYVPNGGKSPVKNAATSKYESINADFYIPWDNAGYAIKQLKSSNPGVVKVSTASWQEMEMKIIRLTAKKTGKATVTFKQNGVTYKLPVVVKKYTSKYSKLKIGSTDLTAKVKKSPVITLSYKKYKGKTLKITCTYKKNKSKKPYIYMAGNNADDADYLWRELGASNKYKFTVKRKGCKISIDDNVTIIFK